jgi:hypothetical protein
VAVYNFSKTSLKTGVKRSTIWDQISTYVIPAGYMLGGNDTAITDTIFKLTFSTDTTATLGIVLSSARSGGAGYASTTNGYSAGGIITGPTPQTTVNKVAFASDSISTLSTGMADARYGGFSFASSTNGYVAGGATASTNLTSSTKMLFSTDVFSIASATLSSQRNIGASFFSTSDGYCAGGETNTGGVVTTVDKINYSGDSRSTLGTGLAAARYLNSGFQSLFERQQDLLASLTKVVAVEEITTLQLRLGRILNPLLDSRDRAYFSYQGRDATTKVVKKLRIVPGRFQLTSTKVEVPLTLVNDFETATVVSLSLIPMNSRVQVENVNDITIPPKSFIQISVPFTVVASGSTLVLAQFITPEGDRIGLTSRLNLTLTVIDSRVAWFTTGAAIFLFLGAIIQSVRRIRKGRNEKQ